MTVEAANVRLSVIEQTWQAASAEERLGYLDELAAMAGTLGQVTGPQAENAAWLTRRLGSAGLPVLPASVEEPLPPPRLCCWGAGGEWDKQWDVTRPCPSGSSGGL